MRPPGASCVTSASGIERRRGSDEDAIERRALGPAGVAVADAHLDVP